jgi:hypothetical protein
VSTATIWRTCPSCGANFEQPDDPDRKRVYCSRACQQATYRVRQRQHATGQRRSDGAAALLRAREGRTGASTRQQWRQDRRTSGTGWRQPPPDGASGQRSAPPAALTTAPDSDALARIRRIIDALPRKASSTTFPHEAAALPRQG